jgi:hypothetical protein
MRSRYEHAFGPTRTRGVDFKNRLEIVTEALVVLIFLLGFRLIDASAQTLDPKQAAIRHQLSKIPTGKSVEVRFLRKEKPTITGKLLAIGEESFKIRTTRSGKFFDEEIVFSAVDSLKKRGMPRMYKVLISAGAVAGAGIAIAATRSSKCG